MARKRGIIGKLFIFVILTLAVIGGYTIYKAKPCQDGLSAAKKTINKAEKAIKAAEKVWK